GYVVAAISVSEAVTAIAACVEHVLTHIAQVPTELEVMRTPVEEDALLELVLVGGAIIRGDFAGEQVARNAERWGRPEQRIDRGHGVGDSRGRDEVLLE